MAVTAFQDLANDDFFPGNLQALNSLREALSHGDVVAFVGSGVSVPLAPSWTGLLKGLIARGLLEGFVQSNDEAYLKEQVNDDPLELASTLEEAMTPTKFRSYLSEAFKLKDECTLSHELLIKLRLQGVFTLNYDDGLSTAYVRNYQKMPLVIRPDDKYELRRWASGGASAENSCPIIHWHGTANAPDKMILTADDYDTYYKNTENRAFIEELWRGRKLFAVGFGFKDPILTRLAEGVLRSNPADNQHVALIGRRESEPMTPLLRRQFTKKYRVNPVFYRITVGDDGREDHSALVDILKALLENPVDPKGRSAQTVSSVQVAGGATADAEREFKSNLFVGGNSQALYVEPRIYTGISANSEGVLESLEVPLEDIVNAQGHAIITAPLESGGTTLARRLVFEMLSCGIDATYREAGKLGNHKAKILEDKAFRKIDSRTGGKNALVLDNFDPASHERTLKEILGIGKFDRIIVISRSRSNDVVKLDDLRIEETFIPYVLSYLNRSDVRSLATQLFDTFDGDLISAAVEKTYHDLLELCIPLTPSNVVMYLSVINREGSFTPLNRLHIMDRFIRDMLHRPSDIYRDSFNADNKLDVVSAFTYDLFINGRPYFNKSDWDKFCQSEMKNSLIWFDKDMLLQDLEASRLIVKSGNNYHLKYKLFYSYFVGKYVAERPSIMPDFMANGYHLALDSLVEVIAGSSKENTLLVTDLVERLEEAEAAFEQQYELKDFDPYRSIEWKDDEKEQRLLWKPVSDKLAEGPAPDSEVDRIKRSITAEGRTSDQNVVIRELSGFQNSLSYLQMELVAALRESQKLDRDLKARSMRAIYKGYRIAMQIGFLFAPIISTRRFFVWNDVAFYNQMNWKGYEFAEEKEKMALVASAIPRAIANKAADELGSRKLGALFDFMATEANSTDFNALLTYALILKSKPEGWDQTAKRILAVSDRNAIYLRYMLTSSLRQFNQEVNTSSDRVKLKRLVANIEAKRVERTANPNANAIDKALRKLEVQDYFGKSAKAVKAYKKPNMPAIQAQANKLAEFKPTENSTIIDQSDDPLEVIKRLRETAESEGAEKKDPILKNLGL